MPDNPLALDISQAAFLKQFPQTDVFESTTKDCGKPVQDQAQKETERNKPKVTNLDIVPVIIDRKVCSRIHGHSSTITNVMTSHFAMIWSSTFISTFRMKH